MSLDKVLYLLYHRYDDFEAGDVVTFYLEERLPLALKSPGRKIARTKGYSPETLWKIQSKQGLGKSKLLPTLHPVRFV